MNARHDIDTADHSATWREMIGAVDYLTETHRPGLTVWDAIEEAMRWWAADYLEPGDTFNRSAADVLPWDDPDPLRTSIERLLAVVAAAGLPDGLAMGDVLGAAWRTWVDEMADRFNDSMPFERHGTTPRSTD